MPPFDQDRFRTHALQVLGRTHQVLLSHRHVAEQDLNLVQIGGDQTHTREQLTHDPLHRFLVDQSVPAGGHHHRVQDHIAPLVAIHRPGHHLHHLRRVQHADLHRINANVIANRLDLRL